MRSVEDEKKEKNALGNNPEKALIADPRKKLGKMLKSFADMIETFDIG